MDTATLWAEHGIAAAAAACRAELEAADAANITCPSCNFVAVDYGPCSRHVLGHLVHAQQNQPANPPTTSARKPAPFKRPSIGICCKPADWAKFMSAWDRYRIGANVPPDARVIEFFECLSKELRTTATHAFLI